MSMVKTIGKLLGLLRGLPNLVCYHVSKAVMGQDRAMTGGSERIGAVPGFIGVYARQFYYSQVLARVGRDVYFGYMAQFSKPGATLGDQAYIGRFCTIGLADIGDKVMLADGVQILSGRHQHGDGSGDAKSLQDNEQQFAKVTVGKGAWIGAGAIVMADVGQGAIVGAGAVVVKPVPAGAKVAGVPAKAIGG
jgi:acetyltransferase-like isoleucine patch superfamily enzyme